MVEDNNTLHAIMEQVRMLLRAEGVILATVDTELKEIVVEHARGVWAHMNNYHISASTGIESYLPHVPRNTASVPLVMNDIALGSLCIGRTTSISQDDLRVLASMGDIASHAIYNQRRAQMEQQRIYDTALEGWVRALELRDNETEAHAQRVTNMTVELAQALGMNDKELVHVRRGALLHDIGKMAIPDSILLKPGPLTNDEWQVMRRHPSYAYEMLAPLSFLMPALDIPLYHHEKWDGSGYPYGLKGEQIPLTARIFSIVDVWDALRFERPYREAWSEERTLEHICSLAGIQFDPAIVPIFLDHVHEKSQVFSRTPRPRVQRNGNQNHERHYAIA
jgi:putative nucleotidyltransferase with HDIG domain